MENKKVALYSVIIAAYTAISLLMGSFSFGMIQIRIAEVLLVICLFDKQFILPITLACFVTNLIGVISGFNPLIMDVIIGTLATFISAISVYYLRDITFKGLPILSLFLPTIINGVLVGIELSFYFPMNILMLIIYVGLGEFVSVTLLGLILFKPIGKTIKQYLE